MKARVAAIVLAAGASTRMQTGRSKLLEEIDGRALVLHAVAAAASAQLSPVVVVTGDARLRELLRTHHEHGVRLAHDPAARAGMGESIRCGVAALADETLDGVFIQLGDMPDVQPGTFARLLEVFEQASDAHAICAPLCDGRRGHPVLFGAAHFAALAALSGDVGARSVLAQNAAELREVAVDDPGIHFDVDTESDLERARAGRS